MSYRTKISLFIAIFLWASAYVGIRAGLQDYSPAGLALLRYLVASLCLGIVYFRLPTRSAMRSRDVIAMFLVGAVGIGLYNLSLNYGEISVSSGMASFITSQSPIITTVIAMLFLGERITFMHMLGFTVSFLGIALIALGEIGGLKWDEGLTYVLLATLAGGFYSVLQKPFLKKYHAIEATTYVIWGGTLSLVFYAPQLQHDLMVASFKSTLTVVYLGVFPAALGYIAWSYVLAEISASRAVSFIYFMPFLATLLGWLCLDEVPVFLSFLGGLLAILGVWLVNRAYRPVNKPSEELA